MYIALEGIDTAGKSTQIKELQKYFKDAIITKEPGGTQVGTKIREIVLEGDLHSKKAEFLLFLADRAEHMDEIIKPNRDRLIISDRSAISGVAYALVQGSIDSDDLVKLNNFATDGIYPDIAFLLRLSPEELSYRLSQKELDCIEKRGEEYLLCIQEAIIQAADLLGIELVIIDATKGIKQITEDIIKKIDQ
ncbi:Thymidylate kinase [hydrothermal vent metagenome]|uniref:dTMP kinase n=1 Tax=hydrothermal vent metagenome TaxID=652676 RepID=A0A1W1C657_9ZZZZ